MERFLSTRWTTIRQLCIFAGLILSTMVSESTLNYCIILLLVITAFTINLMQFIVKTRTNMYNSIFYRIYDILMLLFLIALAGVLCYILYTSQCPVCSV